MKQKIKEFSKKYLVGFIIGSILFGTLGVYAVTYFPGLNTTYDNSNSGMTSTNVQDALDELYSVCVPPTITIDQIIEDNNLEKDPYECRYFFTGANPNNYITFNDEQAGWRIISVECDGTMKIMKNESIGNSSFSGNNNGDWSVPADLNTYLNNDYYNNLSLVAKKQIVEKEFSIGDVSPNYGLATQVNDENDIKWNGKVALPTASEYIRTNSNMNNCGTLSNYNKNYSSCKNTTWMYNNVAWWTLSRASGYVSDVYYVASHGTLPDQPANYPDKGVRPTLYISSSIKITGGTGTQSDPYTIE